MRRLGKQGLYREAIRAFLSLPIDTEAELERGGIAVELQLQYAIALQHAGLFGAARDSYEKIVAAATAGRLGKRSADVRYNATVQLAVLRERLGDPHGALALLDDLGSVDRYRDLELARASLPSWISITRLKSLLALGRTRKVRALATRLSREGDWNEQLWAAIFISLLELQSRPAKKRAAAVKQIREAIAQMFVVDPSGAPWTALLAGKYASPPSRAREFLEIAHAQATMLGKFFVIAEAAELLSQNKRVEKAERAQYLRRAISAYARCNLLMQSPFRQRMFHAASKTWTRHAAQQAMLQSAHLLEAREKLVFSQMCKRLAGKAPFGKTPEDVFEDFVRDWAMTRFPGEYKHVEKGQWTADAIVVQDGEAVVLQAKHVARPKQHIPKVLYFARLRETYGISVKRYVFVLSSSRAKGWLENDWQAHWTEILRNRLPEGVECQVVAEPELQTDVLLNDALYDKYFGAYLRHGR